MTGVEKAHESSGEHQKSVENAEERVKRTLEKKTSRLRDAYEQAEKDERDDMHVE